MYCIRKKRIISMILSVIFTLGILTINNPALAVNNVKLSQKNAGDEIEFAGMKWILLEPDSGFMISKDVVGQSRKFAQDFKSDIRFDTSDIENIGYWLNNDFFENYFTNLQRDFILNTNWTNDTKNNSNSFSQGKVGLISYDEYNKYKNIIPNCKKHFWTRNSKSDKRVWCVKANESMYLKNATSDSYVRPVIYVNPDCFVKDNKIIIDMDDQDKKKAPIKLIKMTDKAQVKVEEEVNIKYTIQPESIPVSDVIPEIYLKDKQVVLVMDVSGSMEELIEFSDNEDDASNEDDYTSIFDSNLCPQNVKLHKTGRYKWLNNYFVTFDKPSGCGNNRIYYQIFYSTREQKEIENMIKNYSYTDFFNLSEIYGRANWASANRKNHFYHWQKNLEGTYYNTSTRYNAYVLAFDYFNNKVVGLKKADKLINEVYKNKRIDVMKNVAKDFVSKFKGEASINFALVPYDSISHDYTYNGESFVNMKDLSKFDKLLDDIDKLSINNNKNMRGTNIGDGLRNAYYKLSKFDNNSSKKYIILMTDGEPTIYSYYIKKGKRYYFDSEGKAYNVGPKKNNDYEHGYEYAYKITNELIANGSQDIAPFFIGFSNGANKEKLKSLKDACGGYYKEAYDGNVLEDVYNEIENQIKSDLPIHGVFFKETFSEGFDIVNCSDNLVIDDNTVTGNIGSILYKLNDDKTEFEAEPINFWIKLKALEANKDSFGKTIPYSVSLDSAGNNMSYITYQDIDGVQNKKEFNQLNITVYDTELPQLKAELIQIDDDNFKLTTTINKPCDIYVGKKLSEQTASIAYIDAKDEFNLGQESVSIDTYIKKNDLPNDSFNITIVDVPEFGEEANSVSEVVSNFDLDDVKLNEYEHQDDTRPVILSFKAQSNTSIYEIKRVFNIDVIDEFWATKTDEFYTMNFKLNHPQVINVINENEVVFTKELSDGNVSFDINEYLLESGNCRIDLYDENEDILNTQLLLLNSLTNQDNSLNNLNIIARDGNNNFVVSLMNEYGNITRKIFNIDIDAISPNIDVQEIEGNRFLKLTFDEIVDKVKLYVDVDENENYTENELYTNDDEEIIIQEDGLSAIVKLENDWYKKKAIIKARDVAKNVRSKEYSLPNRRILVENGVYEEMTNLIQNDDFSLNVINTYNNKIGMILYTENSNVTFDLIFNYKDDVGSNEEDILNIKLIQSNPIEIYSLDEDDNINILDINQINIINNNNTNKNNEYSISFTNSENLSHKGYLIFYNFFVQIKDNSKTPFDKVIRANFDGDYDDAVIRIHQLPYTE
ncbi:vWA domain-containing protein [Abyssisolibacter fermentans]|uniref:vWA domain-containing protein n=1 Tax=Abyssisolibacter fermentans TaxID=1766203 RepID=UPI00082F1DF4|nr:vWA domain-containing protein [Abyssisolibacter fermentans]